jgi:hypothetical protein
MAAAGQDAHSRRWPGRLMAVGRAEIASAKDQRSRPSTWVWERSAIEGQAYPLTFSFDAGTGADSVSPELGFW